MDSVFTPEWLDAFVAHARTAPWEGREVKLAEYFDAVDRMAADFGPTLGLVSTTSRYRVDPDTEAVRIDLEGGRPVRARRVAPEGLADVPLVLAGSPAAWRRVLAGDEDVAKAVMYRDLYLWQGDIHGFFRRIYFLVELLRLGQKLRPAPVS
jgi:hypothetical protein